MRRGCCCGGNECYTNAYISLVVSQPSDTYFECDNFDFRPEYSDILDSNLNSNDQVYGINFNDVLYDPYGECDDPDSPECYGSFGGPFGYSGLNEVNRELAVSGTEHLFFTPYGESNFPFSHRWHKDETEEFGNLFCMLDEDVFHPKVSASKYGITPEMRADDVTGGQIDAQGKVRVGLELALHYKYYDPNENYDWTQEIFYDTYEFAYGTDFIDEENQQLPYLFGYLKEKQNYPACVENPFQYIESDEFIPKFVDPVTGELKYGSDPRYSGYYGYYPPAPPEFNRDWWYGSGPVVRKRPNEPPEFGDTTGLEQYDLGKEVPCFYHSDANEPFSLVGTQYNNYSKRFFYQGYNNGENDGHVFCADWFIRQANNVPPSCSVPRCVTNEQLCEWIKSPEAKLAPPYGPDRRDYDGIEDPLLGALDGNQNIFSCQCSSKDPISPNAISTRCCGYQFDNDYLTGWDTGIWGTFPINGHYSFPAPFTTRRAGTSIYGIDTGGDPKFTFSNSYRYGYYYNFFDFNRDSSWHDLVPYTCPPKPPTCLGAEKPGLPGLEYLFKEVSPREGDTKGELNGTSEIVEYTYNKIIQRFGPTILPNGEVNPLPNNIIIQVEGGPSFSIDEIGAIQPGGVNKAKSTHGMYVDFAEALFQKYVDEHGIDVAIQRFSTCGVNHPQEYGGDGCVGFDCLEPTVENHGKYYMGYQYRYDTLNSNGTVINTFDSANRYYTPCDYYHTEYPFDDEYPHPYGVSDPLGLRSHTRVNTDFLRSTFSDGQYFDDPDGYNAVPSFRTGDDEYFYGFYYSEMAQTFRSGRGLGALFYTPRNSKYSGIYSGYVYNLFASLEHWLCPNCSYDGKNEFINEEKFNKYYPDIVVDRLTRLWRRSYTKHPDSTNTYPDGYLFSGMSTILGPLGPNGEGATGPIVFPGKVIGEAECWNRGYYGDQWTDQQQQYWDLLKEYYPNDVNGREYYYVDPDVGANYLNEDDPTNYQPPQGGHIRTWLW